MRNNALSIVTVSIFLLLWLVGQSLTGYRVYNDDQESHGEPSVSYVTYLHSGHFGEATFENWESEFLQMGTFVLLTVWLRQKGSAESRPFPEDEQPGGNGSRNGNGSHPPRVVRRGGVFFGLYKRSLSTAFFVLFGIALVLHALTGTAEYNQDLNQHGEAAISVFEYVRSSQFWFESLQNWQSEFLAVAAIVILTIFLRHEGSPESKPVDAPHATTGS